MVALPKFMRAPWITKTLVTAYDSLLGGLCMYGAMQWRYDFENKPIPGEIDYHAAVIFATSVAVVWIIMQVHKAVWRFTSLDDIRVLLQGVILATLIAPIILFLFFNRAEDFPRSVPFIAGPLFFLLLTISRVIVLFFANGDTQAMFRGKIKGKPNAILVGPGDSIHDYLRDVNRKVGGPGFNIIGLIDAGDSHKGRSIRGVPVLGGLKDIKSIYARITDQYEAPATLIATDTNPDKIRAYKLVRTASEMSAPLVRVSPSHTGELTPFEAADLIGRDVKSLNITPVQKLIEGKRVLITGAGGTIGSELTRQVAALSPKSLTLVDISEYNLYKIDQTLVQLLPTANGKKKIWTAKLGDICHEPRMREVFEEEKPEIILHAAALKHVPMSEANPIETLGINVGGTNVLIDLAVEHKVESFTLISTDKAVAPSNIMGASKRVAEMLTMASESDDTELSACAVRFGNVLASTGSVIPLFEEQIARGGPVTVTHKDVNRYFMTTEEAAVLVLQATALNANQKDSEASVYVLEMGDPVNIAKLARQLIRLRGLVPDRDIKIVYTGLRPGEKLTEHLTGKAENLEPTYVEGVQKFTGFVADPKSVQSRVEDLMKAVKDRKKVAIVRALAKLIPDYEPNGGLSD